MRVLIQDPFQKSTYTLELDSSLDLHDQIIAYSSKIVQGEPETFRYSINGEDLSSAEISDCSLIQIETEVLGGKGGYGNNLRMQAAQKKHFDDHGPSRDLNGRRVRDIRNEVMLRDWVRKKIKEEKFVEKEQALMAKDTSQAEAKRLRIQQAYIKIDKEYNNRVKGVTSNIRNAVKIGLGKRALPSGLEPFKPVTMESEEEKNRKEKIEKNKKLLGIGEKQVPTLAESLGLATKKLKVQDTPESHSQSNNMVEMKESETEVSASQTSAEEKEHKEIDLKQVSSVEEILAMGGEYLKKELMRLGLKCGGTPLMRAQRLWDIKVNPANLFNRKYLAKPKK